MEVLSDSQEAVGLGNNNIGSSHDAAAPIGEGFCRLNEQCLPSSTFLLEHQFVCKEGSSVCMDDEMGLVCNKEPLDKGFYSDNDTPYNIEAEYNGSEDGSDKEEQPDAVKQLSQTGELIKKPLD
ncbi:unnamed protein product [Ilex paraguariensis]|uniref:Uncharacterized protein n=1 Tax=Ilex paraguariensis TaxID=185542 RepID=A0ABC8RV28_9AQUA